jgi:hypothetical protein
MATSSPRTESEIDVTTELRSLVWCRPAALARGAAVLVLAAFAAGRASAGDVAQDCDDFFGGYTHRIEGITVGAGDAAASNTASQIIDPWPPYSRDRHIRTESTRMIGAIRRYQANSAAKAPGALLATPSPDAPASGSPADASAMPDAAAAPSPDGSAGE